MSTYNDVIRILHLEDMAEDAALIRRAIKQGNLTCEILVLSNRADFIVALRNFKPDIILSDHSMLGFSSLEALAILKYSGLQIPFILVSGNSSEEFMVKLKAEGMTDYIMKERLQRLPGAIVHAIWQSEIERRLAKLVVPTEANGHFISGNNEVQPRA